MTEAKKLLDMLRKAAVGKPYTKELVRFLKNHNCCGFVDHPVEEFTSIERFAQKIIIKQRFQIGSEFFSEMNGRQIPYAVVKGAVLSKRIYGTTTARISGDVDIVIPQQFSDIIKLILKQCGFQQGLINGNSIIPHTRRTIIYQATQTHQLAPFVHKTACSLCPFVEYDINTSLFWGESNNSIDMNDFLSDCENMVIDNVHIQTLPKEKEFISLCLHHYKDWNSLYIISQRGIPISHFFDIYG